MRERERVKRVREGERERRERERGRFWYRCGPLSLISASNLCCQIVHGSMDPATSPKARLTRWRQQQGACRADPPSHLWRRWEEDSPHATPRAPAAERHHPGWYQRRWNLAPGRVGSADSARRQIGFAIRRAGGEGMPRSTEPGAGCCWGPVCAPMCLHQSGKRMRLQGPSRGPCLRCLPHLQLARPHRR